MDFLTQLLAGADFSALIVAVVGAILTFIANRAAAAFTAWTGIQIEAQHRDALHRAIQSAVESAVHHGGREALTTIKAHVVQHLRESVPDALKALTPGDGVLDRLIDRYVAETLNRIGEPK